MRATNSLARLCWAACVLGTLGLHAQDAGFNTAIKLRLDTTTQSKDNLSNNGLGVGAEFRYTLPVGTIGAELGYFYKDGDPYIQTIGDAKQGMSAVDPANSGDSRRNQLSGLSVRFTFQRKLNETWDWQGGLMIGGTKFRHQYVGDVRSAGWGKSGGTTTWRDTYQGTPEEGGFKVSPFAGVNWKMDETSSLELNLLLLNYTALEYVHNPGSGTYSMTSGVGNLATNNDFPDSLEKHSRLVPHLEIAYAFHF
jgi:hypothetical protein